MAVPSETKREKLVRVQLARLRTILIASGDYNTDIGNQVFYFRTGTFSEEELAAFTGNCALVVRDIDETKAVYGDHTRLNKVSTEPFARDLHMQLEIVQVGTTSPTTVHKVIADIETAIRKDIRWKDVDGKALAIGTRPRIDRSVVEQESKKVAGVIYEYFVHYTTQAFNAYE